MTPMPKPMTPVPTVMPPIPDQHLMKKLESLGILAGGMAHDFNNLLTGILGFTDLALQMLPADSPARPMMSEALSGVKRATELTEQMLLYSGRTRFVAKPLSLSDLVEATKAHLQELLPAKAKLVCETTANLPMCEGDSAQLRQLLTNLVANAAEALSDAGGTITVRTGVVSREVAARSTYFGPQLTTNDCVFLEIVDDGRGIPDGVLSKIFDPFYTTKTHGRGFGLAMVLGIVRGHRAAIHVESRPQQTVFTMYLPVATIAAPPDSTPLLVRKSRQMRNIALVVDDETAVRYLATLMLEKMGFHVVAAADGRQGVDLFRTHADRIRFVLLDMTMPVMDGAETYAVLKTIQPDVQVVLSSGYSEQMATNALTGFATFLQKPYRFEQLQQAVQKVRDVGVGIEHAATVFEPSRDCSHS